MASQSTTPSDLTGVFVTRYPRRTKREEIESHFSKYGSVVKVQMGNLGRYAWVHFDNAESANKALQSNGETFKDSDLVVEPMIRQANRQQNPKRIYIGNLPEGVQEQDVRVFLQQCGSIEEIKLFNARCFALVTFADEESAAKAVDLSGSTLNGSEVRINRDGERRTRNKRGKAPRQPAATSKTSVFVGNFPNEITEESIRTLLNSSGISGVQGVEISENRAGTYRAIVSFNSEAEAAALAEKGELSTSSATVVVRPAREPRPAKDAEPRARKQPAARANQKRENGAPRKRNVRLLEPSELNVYVGDLNNTVTDNAIVSALSRFGEVERIERIRRETAFAVFQSPDQANAAISAGKATVGDIEARLESQSKPIRLSRSPVNKKRVFVKGFADDADANLAQEAFKHCGEIKDVRMLGKEGRKYAYITFDTPEAAQQALTHDGKHLAGKQVVVDYAQPPRRRTGPRGRAGAPRSKQ